MSITTAASSVASPTRRTLGGWAGPDYPFLRLYPAVDDGREDTSYLRIVAYGDLALLAHPYLQVGSKIPVQARYRQRQRRDRDETVHEFVADHIVFIDKIDWERGGAAREQLARAD